VEAGDKGVMMSELENSSTESVPDEVRAPVGDYLIEGVYGLIVVVTVVTWAVIGFMVWVPLLIRTTAVLAGTIFYATLFRDQARVVNSQRSVHMAVRFYIRGFEHFVTFYRQRHDPDPPIGFLEPISDLRWKELLIECLWVICVWAMLTFTTHSLFG